MSNLKDILGRIEAKKSDYERYGFSQKEDNAFKSFFDLAQEFDDIGDFYNLCVAVPKIFFGLDARLYIAEPDNGGLKLVATTGKGGRPTHEVVTSEHPYCTKENTLVLTIRGKKLHSERQPLKTNSDVTGAIEICPADMLNPHQQFYFEKYANRIGFNLHNRMLAEKNIEHLRFIKSLVADIEHNIIAPNMVYKLFLRNLKNKIDRNHQIEGLMGERLSEKQEPKREEISHFLMELNEVNTGLDEEFAAIERHYQNVSLFLETLLRRSHFDQGRLTLRTKTCNMKKDVVEPQLAQYGERFRRMGIHVDDRLSGIPDEDTISVVDMGLLAQVYANLFSNALKYTKEVVSHDGRKLKYISYGREVLKNFFGPGQDGIKYNVFSAGPHIPPDEHKKIFEEGYRGRIDSDKPGTGHGLAFIKNVIELHGGVAGYEPTHIGNNFYFILPK